MSGDMPLDPREPDALAQALAAGPEPAPMPGDAPKPDHTASADPSSPEAGGSADSPPDNVRRLGGPRPFRRGKGDPKKTDGKTLPPKRAGQLVRPLTQFYTSIGIAVSAFDPVCGETVLGNAEDCAKSLDELAQRNDAVRRALYAMVETGAWGGVIAAHLPLLAVAAMHHGPPNLGERLAPIVAFTAPEAAARMAAQAGDHVTPDDGRHSA